MSADHLLYQMGHPGQNDWFDFDNSFDYASGYLDCAPDAVNSISPEDYSLPFNDLDTFPDLVNFDQAFDEAMKTTPAPMSGTIPMFGDATMSPDSGLFPDFDTSCQQNHFDWTSSLRDMVDARAAADPSCLSTKEKRRDAGIAVHLQRLHDVSEREVSSDSNTSFSSPSWSNFVRDSTSPTPQSTSAITSFSAEDSTPMSSDSDPTPGGMELVLDLNMNAPSNLPKKQKPRSLAQKENYIKARKYGACEKHRKQHKRVCTVHGRRDIR